MEELDITQLFNYFKSKIIYIFFAASIFFCLSSIYVNKFRVPKYTSETTILLNQANENAAINTSDINLNKSLVTTYGEIIKSKRVLNQVIEKLNLDLTYKKLNSMVSVGEITDTSIISIKVTDEDNELACSIANEIADVFASEIVSIYKIENISTIDKAEVSEIPSSASTLKIVSIGTLLGAVLSVMIIFISFYFDNTIKDEEKIESITNLPVIGVVPISSRVKNGHHEKHEEELTLPIAKKNK